MFPTVTHGEVVVDIPKTIGLKRIAGLELPESWILTWEKEAE
jgi:hypothetical protein